MTVRAQYLWLDLILEAPSGDALELLKLSYLSCFATERTISLKVGNGPGYSLAIDGVAHEFPGSLQRAEYAYGYVHNTLMEGALVRGWHRLHAALVEVRGFGIVIAGPSGAGKTNLAVNMAGRGAQIHSDEGVFLVNGRALGLPRRLHLKEGSRRTLEPYLFERSIKLNYPSPIWAVDPGQHWELPMLRPLEIAAVVFLGTPFMPVSIRPAGNWEALSGLASEGAGYTNNSEHFIAELSRLITDVPCLVINGYYDNSVTELIYELAK